MITAILGAGYTGSIVRTLLEKRGETCIPTRREEAPAAGIIRFDLPDTRTWGAAQRAERVVWCFPAEPVILVSDFRETLEARRIVVIGTTSSYLQEASDQELDESAPLDLLSPRVQGEEALRERGAVVLRSAGIYGPGRNPLDWLRSGRIGDPEGYLNLIHAEDLAAAAVAALDRGAPGSAYIVSDGTPRRWAEIEAWATSAGLVQNIRYSGAGRPSRRLSNRRLLHDLAPGLTHTDLYRELEALERGR